LASAALFVGKDDLTVIHVFMLYRLRVYKHLATVKHYMLMNYNYLIARTCILYLLLNLHIHITIDYFVFYLKLLNLRFAIYYI